MRYDKILFLDAETTALDPTIASVRELAYVKEIDGEQIGDIQSFKVSPILHCEDQLYGGQGIEEFCAEYNKKFHPQDPDRLETFKFPGGNPLFFYSKAVRTFNLPAPAITDPSDWLVGSDKVSPYQVCMDLIDYLSQSDKSPGRWILAGHNVQYDHNVLIYWTRRLLGQENAKCLLDKFNKYVHLDTLALSRWYIYSGRLQTDKANLSEIAKELGIDTKDMHSAKADVFASREIAQRLLFDEVTE